MKIMEGTYCGIAFFLFFLLPFVCGSGRLMDPPSRSSMWRVGYATPKNNNDGELNCGGFSNEWYTLHGKCGICGDPWQDPQPRQNEAGGLYGKGIITKNYRTGQEIQISVHIESNHGGWFEFRLCANNNPKTVITQSCLDQHLLQVNGGDTRHYVAGYGDDADVVVAARLPVGLTCSQCVLQWKWNGGDQLGMDPNGTACIGCGHQNEHYGCSDIAIGMTAFQQSTTTRQPHSSVITTMRHTSSTTVPTWLPLTTKQLSTTLTPTKYVNTTLTKLMNAASCHGINQWAGDLRLDQWCVKNCARGLCPPTKCDCSGSVPTQANLPSTFSVPQNNNCHGVHLWAGIASLDQWCGINCATGLCPPVFCQCSGSPPTQSNLPSTFSVTQNNNCHGVHLWAGIASLDQWCGINCATGPCPKVFCHCSGSAPTQSLPPLTLGFSLLTQRYSPLTQSPLKTPTAKYPHPISKATTKQIFPPTHGIHSPPAPLSLQASRPPYMTSSSILTFTNIHRTSTQALTTVPNSTQFGSTTPQTIDSTQSGPCHAINTWKGIPMLDTFCNNVCTKNSYNLNTNVNSPCSQSFCECNFP